LRDCSNPSGFTTGTTSTRAFPSRPVMRASPPLKPFTRSTANSIACSPDGHSRAWWTPIIRNVGFPSVLAATLSLISTPRISRPSSERRLRENSLTSAGFALASARRPLS
jgi:hypothetical protein